MTLYASVQCVPDLSSEDCLSCLQQSIKEFYLNKVGGRVLVPSCNSRYELYPFYELDGTLLPPPVSAPPLPVVKPPQASASPLRSGKNLSLSVYFYEF